MLFVLYSVILGVCAVSVFSLYRSSCDTFVCFADVLILCLWFSRLLLTYTYDINSLLEVEVKVVSTGLTQKMIIKGQDNQRTDDEIQKRMEELSYLKIQPRDLEENRLVLLRAERMYEEALGDRRKELDRYITVFEAALKKGKKEEIEEAREALNEILEDEDE